MTRGLLTALVIAAASLAGVAAAGPGAPQAADVAQPEGPVTLLRTIEAGPGLVAHLFETAGQPLCGETAEGPVPAFVIEGSYDAAMTWHPGGRTAACFGGALAKCVIAGFRPWEGEKARATHQACVRMMRADYCGDGVAHTEPGTRIRFAASAPPPGRTEAGWAPDGAHAIRRTRFPEAMAYVRATCPERLLPEPGTGVLLWNE